MQIVGFFGVDGCGKSTLIEVIKNDLNKEKVKFKHFHFRPGFLPYLNKNKNIVKSGFEISKPRNIVLSIIVFLYYWLDCFLGLIIYKLLGYDLIIWERPLKDAIIFPKRYSMKINRFLKFIELKFPFRYLIFFIHCNPDLIFSRKDELSLDQIKFYSNLYKSNLPSYLSLDCSLSIDELKNIFFKNFNIK